MNTELLPEGTLPVFADIDGTVVDFFRGRIGRPGMPRVICGINSADNARFCGFATERPEKIAPYSRWQIDSILPEDTERSMSHFGAGNHKAAKILEIAMGLAKGKDEDRIGADLAIIDNLPRRLGVMLLKLYSGMENDKSHPVNIIIGVPPTLRGNAVRDLRFAAVRNAMQEKVLPAGGEVRGFNDKLMGAGNGGVEIGGLRIMFTRIGESTLRLREKDGLEFVNKSLEMVSLLDGMSPNDGNVRRMLRTDNTMPRPFSC